MRTVSRRSRIVLPALACLLLLPVSVHAQFAQQGSKQVGSGNTGASQQGRAVAISADGNTLVIGGVGDNSFAGAAWVFTRSGTTWSQQGSKLIGSGSTGSNVQQGMSVAISADGNTILVGAL